MFAAIRQYLSLWRSWAPGGNGLDISLTLDEVMADLEPDIRRWGRTEVARVA